MSKTYNLVCPETKTAIWCGQRDYLYGGEKLELLAKWLHDHEGKAVFFVNDESELLGDIEYNNWVGMEEDYPPNAKLMDAVSAPAARAARTSEPHRLRRKSRTTMEHDAKRMRRNVWRVTKGQNAPGERPGTQDAIVVSKRRRAAAKLEELPDDVRRAIIAG